MPLADMWRQGELPPPEVQLSRATLLEIKRLKAWADRRQAELFEVQARAAGARRMLDEHEGAEIFSTPTISPPQQQRGHFDPAVLARAAQLANGPRIV